MAPITNQMINAKREQECVGITEERKFFHVGDTFIKRSLRPSEWQVSPVGGKLVVPRLGAERIMNEAATLEFIAANTNIPVPKVQAVFEDDQAAYLVTEYIEGVPMDDLRPDERRVVQVELEGYLETLRALKSDTFGGPTGIVIPPYRVMKKSARPYWTMKTRGSKDLVFCHNDFSTSNVIVDPQTLKVNGIVDWEYAGYFPAEFEGLYFRRPGPSVAIEGEQDDEDDLLEVMHNNEVDIVEVY